jgi:ATP-binding cassette subfamily B protein
LARILAEARPYRRPILGILALGLLGAPLALLAPVPLKIAVDSVIGQDPVPSILGRLVPAWLESSPGGMLLLAACLHVAVVFLIQSQSLLSAVLQTHIGERLTLQFRARLLDHAQRLSFAFHDRRGTADSIYRIQYDAPSIQFVAISTLVPFLSSVLTLVSVLYVISRIHAQLALVAVVILPVLFLYTRVYRSRIRPKHKKAKRLESSALNLVQEVLTSFRVVKAFGREDHEKDRFIQQSRKGKRVRVRLALAGSAFDLAVQVTTAAGTATVLAVGAIQVRAGAISLGELLMVLTYLARLYAPVETISRRVASLQNQLASAERVFELLDEMPEVSERPGARPIRRARGEFEFRNVSFAYEGDECPILRQASFRIPAGSRVGIVGKTGAGKTTLVNLLNRSYDPSSGSILLDGVDLRDCRIADLRDQFAILMQDPVLFSTSIAENIAYAKLGAAGEEITRAARAAGAHDFIMGLPNGYDTLVGERGMRLSGGERQRVSLARAFLKNAPILILDEPTSSVDPQTEAAIVADIEKLAAEGTTFIISHRMGALAGCELLLVVEDGRVLLRSGEAALARSGAALPE